jgi:hypothetical protein
MTIISKAPAPLEGCERHECRFAIVLLIMSRSSTREASDQNQDSECNDDGVFVLRFTKGRAVAELYTRMTSDLEWAGTEPPSTSFCFYRG